MSFMSLLGIGSSLLGGVMSKKSADKEQQALRESNEAAIEEQRRQFDLTREDLAPFLEAERFALGEGKKVLRTGTESVNFLNAMLLGDYGISGRDGDASQADVNALIARRDALSENLYRTTTTTAPGAPADFGGWKPYGYLTHPDQEWDEKISGEALNYWDGRRIDQGQPSAPAAGPTTTSTNALDPNVQAEINALNEQIDERNNAIAQAARYKDFDPNTAWTQSPGYQFRLAEGNKALERRQAAGGARLGGRAVKEAVRYNQGEAAGEYGNYINRVFSLAGIGRGAAGVGSGAASTVASAGQNTANSISNAMLSTGRGVAGSIREGGANMNNALQSGFRNLAFENYMGRNALAAAG